MTPQVLLLRAAIPKHAQPRRKKSGRTQPCYRLSAALKVVSRRLVAAAARNRMAQSSRGQLRALPEPLSRSRGATPVYSNSRRAGPQAAVRASRLVAMPPSVDQHHTCRCHLRMARSLVVHRATLATWHRVNLGAPLPTSTSPGSMPRARISLLFAGTGAATREANNSKGQRRVKRRTQRRLRLAIMHGLWAVQTL